MKKLFPVLLALIGLGAGIGGGMALRPDPVLVDELGPCGDVGEQAKQTETPVTEDVANANVDYVKLNNQFVIPVVDEGRVVALVVLALSLEVSAGGQELVYQREPKLRDAFLQVMFDHANAGGFDGTFTSGRNMTQLREALKEIAIKTLGTSVSDVLIVDVVRQDT